MHDTNLDDRQELLAWLNNLLQLNVTKVEQCGTGYVQSLRQIMKPDRMRLAVGLPILIEFFAMQRSSMPDLRQHLPYVFRLHGKIPVF